MPEKSGDEFYLKAGGRELRDAGSCGAKENGGGVVGLPDHAPACGAGDGGEQAVFVQVAEAGIGEIEFQLAMKRILRNFDLMQVRGCVDDDQRRAGERGGGAA